MASSRTQLGVAGEVVETAGVDATGGRAPAGLLDPRGSTTQTRPQRKACRLASTAVPFSSMARSMAAADSGRTPAW